jgi:hypothetical protein
MRLRECFSGTTIRARRLFKEDHKGLTMISTPVLLRISVFVGIHAGMLLGLFAFF